jgi:hypothetical protein
VGVYRPPSPRESQIKTGREQPSQRSPPGPSVYRPQSLPRVLQRKVAISRRPHQDNPAIANQSKPKWLPAKDASRQIPQNLEPRSTILQTKTGFKRPAADWDKSVVIQRALSFANLPAHIQQGIQERVERWEEEQETWQEQAARERREAVARRMAADAKALADRKAFYRLNAQQAHVYVQHCSAGELQAMRFSLELFRTYECKGGGYGGEYMFRPMERNSLIANSVIHVHWNNNYDRQYAHFKNHTDKTVGGGSLGAIDAAKASAIGVPAQETNENVQLKKKK